MHKSINGLHSTMICMPKNNFDMAIAQIIILNTAQCNRHDKMC